MKIRWGTFVKKVSLDKDKFPFGLRFYDGVQGAGKTLSMLADTYELLKVYPDLLIISNVKINKEGVNYYLFGSIDELIQLLEKSQKVKHTVVIIDEGLTYFAENGGINPALMSAITQNRKCRRLIMVSSQKFKRLNNRIRDFSLETVVCRCFFGKYQWNIVRDDTNLTWDKELMDFVGAKKYSYIFKRSDELFNSYDTFQNIKNLTINTSSLFSPRGSPVAVEGTKGGLKVTNKGLK